MATDYLSEYESRLIAGLARGKLLISGSADRGRGVSTSGDVLVNVTADGVDLNQIWAEIQDVLELYNSETSAIISLLSSPTVNVADAVAQSISLDSFEMATEFGAPHATRPPADTLKLGYSWHDWDLRLSSTWKFLRDATAEQVTAGVTRVFDADVKLTTGTILNRLFSPTPELNEWQHTVYGLWNADGQVPPPYLGRTFDGNHSHYLTTDSTVLDSADIEAMITHVREHGYGASLGGKLGGQFLILANPDDVATALMTSWRAGVSYRTDGPLPLHDFIPSALMPAWISNEMIHGPVPNADFNGLQVYGSYAGALLIQTEFVPAGWAAVVATGGPGSNTNPIAFRQHVNGAYQGLRHIPGPNVGYPLLDSFFVRGFGVGTRHRGAAVVTKITAAGPYTAPTNIPT